MKIIQEPLQRDSIFGESDKQIQKVESIHGMGDELPPKYLQRS